MSCPVAKRHFVKQNQDWEKSRGYLILKIKGSESLGCSDWRKEGTRMAFQFSKWTLKRLGQTF